MNRAFCKYLKREDGNSTIEFVIMFPLVLMIFMSMFEAAMITARQAMLERALDITMRGVRITTGSAPSADAIRAKICNLGTILPDCNTTLIMEMTPVAPPDFDMPDYRIPCINRDQLPAPVTTFTQGVGNQLMVVRACYVVDPVFPLSGAGLGLSRAEDGGYQIVSASAFVAEP